MQYRSLFVRALLGFFLCWASVTGVHAQDPIKGQTQFLEKCASCHANNMKSKLTGPALANTEENWSAYPREELYAWIRNSTSMIAAGHPRATELWNEYKPTVMTSFPNLTDEDVENILLYIKNMATTGTSDGSAPVAAVATGAAGAADAEPDSTRTYLLIVLFILLLLGVGLLGRYINNLDRLAKKQATGEAGAERSLLEILLSPSVIKILVFGLVLFGGYTTVNTAISLGRQQNYAPEQPIKFSHALHAGKNGIDCQYCHDGARRSKHGVIPAMNTCLNCHAAVKQGPTYGTAEILKIYASTGFDPRVASPTYFDSTVSEEVRLKAYAEWLESMNEEGMKENRSKVEADIQVQLAAIKPMLGKTVEWVRIHNLADHVYFNHAQHVSVGKIECQTCHGPVEEMEVLKQYAPLSMGWCINCHRQTNVQFSDNEYYAGDEYKAFERYHKEISEGKRSGVTVEDIGGLECQKCHY